MVTAFLNEVIDTAMVERYAISTHVQTGAPLAGFCGGVACVAYSDILLWQGWLPQMPQGESRGVFNRRLREHGWIQTMVYAVNDQRVKKPYWFLPPEGSGAGGAPVWSPHWLSLGSWMMQGKDGAPPWHDTAPGHARSAHSAALTNGYLLQSREYQLGWPEGYLLVCLERTLGVPFTPKGFDTCMRQRGYVPYIVTCLGDGRVRARYWSQPGWTLPEDKAWQTQWRDMRTVYQREGASEAVG